MYIHICIYVCIYIYIYIYIYFVVGHDCAVEWWGACMHMNACACTALHSNWLWAYTALTSCVNHQCPLLVGTPVATLVLVTLR